MRIIIRNSANIWHKNTQNFLLIRLKYFSDNIFCDNLKAAQVRTPHFYITTKVHKTVLPGKLIVNSICFHASKVSKFVDHYLQTHAKALPSYVQEVFFINKLETVKDKLCYS